MRVKFGADSCTNSRPCAGPLSDDTRPPPRGWSAPPPSNPGVAPSRMEKFNAFKASMRGGPQLARTASPVRRCHTRSAAPSVTEPVGGASGLFRSRVSRSNPKGSPDAFRQHFAGRCRPVQPHGERRCRHCRVGASFAPRQRSSFAQCPRVDPSVDDHRSPRIGGAHANAVIPLGGLRAVDCHAVGRCPGHRLAPPCATLTRLAGSHN